MKKLLVILLTICICTPAVAYQFCDPVGQPGQWFTTGYATVGWIPHAATVRIEILQTPLGGGTPTVAAVFDVGVSPAGGPLLPETGGNWGTGLLVALKARNDILVTGPILKVYENFLWGWRMEVNSVSGRVAVRTISTALGATPLPEESYMPLPTEAANNWPAAPVQKFNAAENSYDCEGCDPGGELGLMGKHLPARLPDWTGVLSYNEVEDGQFIAFSQSIPTLSEWGMIVMGLLVVGAGVVVIRKKRLAV